MKAQIKALEANGVQALDRNRQVIAHVGDGGHGFVMVRVAEGRAGKEAQGATE